MRFTHFKTESARVRFITVSVFCIFFFNYGIMYLIAPIKMEKASDSFILGGYYNDFNQSWYVNIGYSIILSQLILAVMPPITLLINVAIKYVLRAYD